MLQAAVQGRLVPTEAELARAEGRTYEPASELLKRILAERQRRWEEAELARLKAAGKVPKGDKWKEKYREPVSPKTNGLPLLPEGWAWCGVDTVLWDASYGTSQKCTPDAKGPPVLRIPNVLDQAVNLKNLKYATAPADLGPGEVLETNDQVAALSSVDQVSASIVIKARDRSVRFRQAILKWAFEGKLVDQDPNDEPASVLLERIRSERAARAEEDGTVRVARKR